MIHPSYETKMNSARVATAFFVSLFCVALCILATGCATPTGWRQMAFVHQGLNYCAVYDEGAQNNTEPVVVLYVTTESGCSDPATVKEEIRKAKDGE